MCLLSFSADRIACFAPLTAVQARHDYPVPPNHAGQEAPAALCCVYLSRAALWAVHSTSPIKSRCIDFYTFPVVSTVRAPHFTVTKVCIAGN